MQALALRFARGAFTLHPSACAGTDSESIVGMVPALHIDHLFSQHSLAVLTATSSLQRFHKDSWTSNADTSAGTSISLVTYNFRTRLGIRRRWLKL